MKKEQVTSTRTVYSDKCNICKQEIKGFSESNLEYNMRLHKEKHSKVTANGGFKMKENQFNEMDFLC